MELTGEAQTPPSSLTGTESTLPEEPAVLFRRVVIRSFRNIALADFEPAERVNVISGNNGQGKTSLLEALYFSSTSRSFRTEQLREMIKEGEDALVVQCFIEEGSERRTQRAVLGKTTRGFFNDDKPAERLSIYATRTPVVAFHPRDLELVSGPAATRRRLLDRVGLYLDPRASFHRHRYQKALRERQKSLETRGPSSPEVVAYEQIMAEHGAQVTRLRALSAERLIEALSGAFTRMAASELCLDVQYRAGGSSDPQEFAHALAEQRVRDQRSRSTHFGPQKDELSLELDQRSSRHHASQGQQRILTLALKVAELACVRQARGVHPVLLLDDVSSELDRGRTDAVYEFLRSTRSQIFVTTTRSDLFATPRVEPRLRRDWGVAGGQIRLSDPNPKPDSGA